MALGYTLDAPLQIACILRAAIDALRWRCLCQFPDEESPDK